MKLSDYFKEGGMGVIATSGAGGEVNTAIYAPPRIIDENTVAWGMTEGRTREYLKENPRAAYLFLVANNRLKGVRLTLALKNVETSGEMIESIRARTSEAVSPGAGASVKFVAYFNVLETRPLF